MFSECCRPISMHKVCKILGIWNHRVEHLSSFTQEVVMRRSRVFTGKHDMGALMLVLKDDDLKAEAIPVYMILCQTATKYLEGKGEKPTVMVH